MSPEQLVPPRPPSLSQKLRIVHKMLLLENARCQLEQELRALTNTGHEEVRRLVSPSCPTSFFSGLTTAVDMKCDAVDKLSALLKDLTGGPHACVQRPEKTGVLRNRLQPFGGRQILISDVLKFGPMLGNSLMASSVTKAIQVLGATLSPQQLKHFSSQPAAVQQEDTSLSLSSTVGAAVERATAGKPDAALPVVVPGPEMAAGNPWLLSPTARAAFPQIYTAPPMHLSPLVRWGRGDDVQVLHQKQTSSQLLRLLREKAKLRGALEVECPDNHALDSSLSQPVKASGRHRDHRADGGVRAPQWSLADADNRAARFTVRCGESSGSLTFSCVIASQTELWDTGSVCVDVGQGSSDRAEGCSLNAATETNAVSIPEFQVGKFEEAEVVVSHVVSPGDFYVQHADSARRLQALGTSWKASRSYAEQNWIPDVGTRAIGWFSKQDQWCRVEVTQICGVSADESAANGETSIAVKVKRLDHGDTACLSLWNLRTMTPEMAGLPLQALRVSLANVMPVTGGDWSEEAVDWFKAMVHNRTLYARVHPQGPKTTVELFLENGRLGATRRGATLSLRLTQNGHAKHSTLMNRSCMKRKQWSEEWEEYLTSCWTHPHK